MREKQNYGPHVCFIAGRHGDYVYNNLQGMDDLLFIEWNFYW